MQNTQRYLCFGRTAKQLDRASSGSGDETSATSVEILDDLDNVDPTQSRLVTSDGDHAFV